MGLPRWVAQRPDAVAPDDALAPDDDADRTRRRGTRGTSSACSRSRTPRRSSTGRSSACSSGPIRRDLGITDTQMGVLYGLAFALFYTLLGIPLGRAADRGEPARHHRRRDRRLERHDGAVRHRADATISFCSHGSASRSARRRSRRPRSSLHRRLLRPRPPRDGAQRLHARHLSRRRAREPRRWRAARRHRDGTTTVVWPLLGEIRPWQQVFVVVGLARGSSSRCSWRPCASPCDTRPDSATARAFPIAEVVDIRAAPTARTFVCHGLGYALFALVNFATAAWLPTHLDPHLRLDRRAGRHHVRHADEHRRRARRRGRRARRRRPAGARPHRRQASRRASSRRSAISCAASIYTLAPTRRSRSPRSCPTTSSRRSRSAPRSRRCRRSRRTACARRSVRSSCR